MRVVQRFLWLLLLPHLLGVHSHEDGDNDDDDDEEEEELQLPQPITYGSLVKIVHVSSGFLLHSHDIKYGSGSRQQTVTAYPNVGDTNSLWQVMAGFNEATQFEQGKPVKCNSVIRLRHTNTGAWLHSHSGYRAPLSGMQEVTGFGSYEQTDDADDWRLLCLDQNKANKAASMDDYWMRQSEFLLQHKNTKMYLFTSRKSDFNANNCGAQCPIGGQLEVAANVKRVRGAKWTTGHGVYFQYIPDESDETLEEDSDSDSQSSEQSNHDEL